MISANEWAHPEERFVILLLMVSNEASCLFRCPEQRDRCFIKRDNIPRFFKIVTDNHYYGYRYYRTIFAGSLTSDT